MLPPKSLSYFKHSQGFPDLYTFVCIHIQYKSIKSLMQDYYIMNKKHVHDRDAPIAICIQACICPTTHLLYHTDG